MTNKINLKQGIKKYYPLGFLFLIIFGFILIQEAKAKEISVGTASDNIGIGTSAPGTTYRLNVNGNSNITGTLNVTGGITGSSLGATLLNASNISAGTFGSNSGGGNYYFPGILGASGIISATRGDTVNPGSTAFEAREYNYGTTAIDHIEQYAPRIGFHWGAKYWAQLTYFNGMFAFRNSDLSSYMPITAADGLFLGSVGIGTTAPGAKLHVIGNDNQIAVDTTSEGSAGVFLRQSGVNQWEMYDYQDKWHLYNYGTNADAITVLQSNSNVGIGTVSPKQKLDVIGNVGIGAVASSFADEGFNLHIWPSDVPVTGYGYGTSNTANIMIEENDAEQSLAFLGTNSATQKIVFGRTADSGAAQISFNHSISQYNITGGNVNVAGTFTAGNMGGANLVPDSTNMAAYNASLASLTFVDGKTIQALDSPQTGSGNCYQWGQTAMIPVNANNDYEFSIWVKANGIQNIYFGFFVYDSSRNQISPGSLANPYFHTASEQTNDGWVKITAHLRASATPHDSNYVASITSNKSGPNVSDYVMPTNTSYSMVRFGSCYGGTSTAGRVYMYNPVIREVSTLYDSNYGAIWSKFNGSDYNVGIGTSNPGAYKLNVNGSINATSITGAMSGSLNAANVSAGSFGSNLGGGNYSFPGNISVNQNDSLDLVNGGNVGSINLTHPSSGGMSAITFKSTVNWPSDGGYLAFYDHNAGYAYWGGASENSALVLGTTNDSQNTASDVVVLKSAAAAIVDAPSLLIPSGNVGIGNTGSQHQLAVGSSTGDAQAVTIRGYSNTPASWKGSGAFGYSSASVIMGELGGVAQIGGHSATLDSWRDLAINSGGGNVGIGVTDPGYKLDVGGNIRARGNIYTDTNYGYGLVGIYSSGRYQGIFTMGSSWGLPADGTTTGNLYGLAWSHPNAGGVASNLNTHGLLVMENGTFLAAISGSIRSRDDIQTPIFYDRNDTSFYVDPNGSSRLNNLTVTGSITGNISNADTVDGWHRDDIRAWGNLTGKPTLPVSQEGSRYTTDYNSIIATGFFNGESTPSNAPNAYGQLISARGIDTGLQIAGGYSSDNLYFRGWWSSGAGFSPWRTIIHSGNIGSQSVNYASSASSADQVTGTNVAFRVTAGDGNGLKFWNGSDSYKVSMGVGSLYQYGPVTDYSIKTQMDSGSTGRGFTWGREGVAPIAGLNSTSGNMQIAGTMTSAGFIYNSDVKLKKNIATIESPLTKILQLRGVTFNWKKDNTPGVGLIAQEVEQVFPELVSESGGIKSVQYGNLVAPLIEAVKEQQKEIESLNERIKVLEAK